MIWIGGGNGAGKTTVSRALAYRHDLAFYRVDAYAYAHHALLVERGLVPPLDADPDRRWLDPTPEELARQFVEISEHLVGLIIEDLRGMSREVGVVVEGPQLFPAYVAPLLGSTEHGLWLVPTPDFQRRALEERSRGIRQDAETARRKLGNLLARNEILGSLVRAQAAELGLGSRVLDVDGGRDLDATVEYVDGLLAPVSAALPGAPDGERRRALRVRENDAMVGNFRSYLKDLGDAAPPGPHTLPFACECTRLGCTASVDFALQAYDDKRAIGSEYLVCFEHEFDGRTPRDSEVVPS